jgi:hypothetical protein
MARGKRTDRTKEIGRTVPSMSRTMNFGLIMLGELMGRREMEEENIGEGVVVELEWK